MEAGKQCINVGLIGWGDLGRTVHGPILQGLAGVRVAGVADPVGDVTYADYRQLLEQPGLDAVVIATPNAIHAEVAVAAFERRLHVYLEKPLALSATEAQRVLAAWRQAGTVGMIGFNYRCNPLLERFQQRLARSGAGETARSVFSLAPRPMPVWKHARQTGGGVLLDLGSHHVDLARFFFGEEIVAVNATVRAEQLEADTATVEMRFESGRRLESFFSWSATHADRWEVDGPAGTMKVDRYGGGLGYRVRRRFAAGGDVSYRVALERFVAAVRGGQSVSPDLQDGWQSLAVILAAEESVRTGRTVTMKTPYE